MTRTLRGGDRPAPGQGRKDATTFVVPSRTRHPHAEDRLQALEVATVEGQNALGADLGRRPRGQRVVDDPAAEPGVGEPSDDGHVVPRTERNDAEATQAHPYEPESRSRGDARLVRKGGKHGEGLGQAVRRDCALDLARLYAS